MCGVFLQCVRFLRSGDWPDVRRARAAGRPASSLQLGLRDQPHVLHDQRPHPPRVPRPAQRRGRRLRALKWPLAQMIAQIPHGGLGRVCRIRRSWTKYGRRTRGKAWSSCSAIIFVRAASSLPLYPGQLTCALLAGGCPVLRVIIFLSMFWIKRNRPSLGYYIKRCFGSRTKPVYH